MSNAESAMESVEEDAWLYGVATGSGKRSVSDIAVADVGQPTEVSNTSSFGELDRASSERAATPSEPISTPERGPRETRAPSVSNQIDEKAFVGRRLARYDEFSGQTSPALSASSSQLIQELTAIVATEGPILGDRLHQAHVKAAGGQRVGRQIAHALNSAINTATRKGLLVQDNPLSDKGIKPLTYRLPEQPVSVIRELGPRSLDQVPPRELAALMGDIAANLGWADEEVLFRAVLDRYGLRRLTTNAITRLRQIQPLAEDPHPAKENRPPNFSS